MKRAIKILKYCGAGLLGVAAILTLTVAIRSRRTFEAPYPQLAVRHDDASIARGRYLAYGPAHCVDCHADPAFAADRGSGKELPLTGGMEFKLPIGVVRPANLTSDPETGLGALRDDEIARALRHGVGRDGRALVPFMPYNNLSDDDLAAVIAFLRTQAPMKKRVVQLEPNVLGRAVQAFILKPAGPVGEVAKTVVAEPTAAYGRYLAHNVANCMGCHTERDLRTGQFTGKPFAGGMTMKSETIAGRTFTTPNLTPHATTGRMANWNEDLFVARFATGRGAEGSPMPWGAFGKMTEGDLRALYRYLVTVPAVHNDIGETVHGPVQVASE